MKVVVIGGSGLIGKKLVPLLRQRGHEAVPASPSSGVNALTGEGLANALKGADVVVDPRETDPFDAYGKRRGHLRSAQGLFDLALGSMRALRRVPGLPWARLMRLAERTGQAPRGPVVFECVGVPGMIDALVAQTPLRSRIVVVGVCMEPDTIRPSVAVGKEIDLQFVFGYDPAEFHQTLQQVASGRVDDLVGGDGAAPVRVGVADRDAASRLLRAAGWTVSDEGSDLVVTGASALDVNRTLAGRGLYAYELRTEHADLEQVFLDLTQTEPTAPTGRRAK